MARGSSSERTIVTDWARVDDPSTSGVRPPDHQGHPAGQPGRERSVTPVLLTAWLSLSGEHHPHERPSNTRRGVRSTCTATRQTHRSAVARDADRFPRPRYGHSPRRSPAIASPSWSPTGTPTPTTADAPTCSVRRVRAGQCHQCRRSGGGRVVDGRSRRGGVDDPLRRRRHARRPHRLPRRRLRCHRPDLGRQPDRRSRRRTDRVLHAAARPTRRRRAHHRLDDVRGAARRVRLARRGGGARR